VKHVIKAVKLTRALDVENVVRLLDHADHAPVT
jgi:hypothetical protein